MYRRLFSAALAPALLFTCFTVHVSAASEPELRFSDDSVTEVTAGSGYAIDGTALTITGSGVYRISGSCDEGSITVAKGVSDAVLILDDLTLTSSLTAPIAVKKGSTATIHLDGSSVLTNNEDASTEETNADYEGACIKVKSGSSLTFCGDGTLTVNGNSKNAIKGAAESSLIFNEGTYIVNAANNGIAADHSVTINGGTYTITTDNDGIKSVPDVDDTVSTGQIVINGGSFTVNAQGDGIQAETLLDINNGTFNIKTMSGYSDRTFDKDTMSAKGLKASGDREDIENLIDISGGTFTLNTADDAVHSDGDIKITAGVFEIQTGDDGVHADTTLDLGTQDGYDRDPMITVSTSYEGLEGGTVNIYSGKFYTVSSDDGINAAGGSSSGSDGGGTDPFRPGRPGWGSSGDYTINVYGGHVYVDAKGDGLDSNGDLNLYGGDITVFSMASGGDNSPLDTDGTARIEGAKVFGAGTNPMNERPASTTQKYYTFSNRYNAGTVVTLKSGNTVLYSDRLVRNINYLIYSEPSLTTTPSISTGGTVDTCHSNAWAHDWDEGTVITEATETADGVIVFTCNDCGAKEYMSYKAEIDYGCEGHIAEETEEPEDEGYPVTFVTDEGASINIYYTQDYTSADETDVTSAVTRNSDTGKPDSTGSGQVNFTVVLQDGYTLSGISVDGSYKNLKGPEDTGLENTYRITKAAGALTVTVTTEKEQEEPAADPVSLSIDRTSAEMATQETLQLKAAVLPAEADQSVTWTSSDENIARVDSAGKVNALRYGTVTITATSKADSSLRASCTIQTRFYDVNDTGKYYYKPVYWAADNGITTGYDRVYFGPQQNCTRRELSIFLWRLAGKPEASGTLPFSDIGKYAETTDTYKAILWCYTNGIVKGYSDGTFRPDNAIVRKDTMIMLYRLAGRPEATGTLQFADAAALGYGPETDTYRSIVWGTQNGITKGYSDGSFKPLANCLREHIVTFVYRYDQKFN